MTTPTPTVWYRNVDQDTLHEVEAGSPLEQRLQTEIRDNVDRVDELAFRRGDKSKAGQVLAYRRLSASEVEAVRVEQREAALVAADEAATVARAEAERLAAQALALRVAAGD